MIELLPYLAGLGVVATGFVAFGKLSARMAALEAKHGEDIRRLESERRELQLKLEAIQTAHHAAQAQLAKDLEAVRISLARIEASLAVIQKAA